MDKLITIPFQGFYESIHSNNIDFAIEQYLNEDIATLEQVQEFIWEYTSSEKMLNEYCKKYVENLSNELDCRIELTFNKLIQPREYNFVTDTIICTVSEEATLLMLDSIDIKDFTKLCIERFTTRSGFHSFYDPDWAYWGDLGSWDNNQLGALLQSYIDNNLNADWELYLMDYEGDIIIERDISNNLTDKQQSILKDLERE